MLPVLMAIARHHLQGFVPGNSLHSRQVNTSLDKVSYCGMP